MGNCAGGEAGEAIQVSPEEREKARAIEKMLKEEKKELLREVRLLLLGAGGAGKSTFAKQMKVIHLGGFDEKERLGFRDVVYFNFYQNLRDFKLALDKTDIEPSAAIQKFFTNDWISSMDEPLTQARAEAVTELMKDESIRPLFEDFCSKGLIQETALEFLKPKCMERLVKEDYSPTVKDILRVRVKTTGVSEIIFPHGSTQFRMVDVGGQRSERRKWVHYFQNVQAVIFFVAMSEYNQNLEEAPGVQRMTESVALFEELVNEKWFAESSFILFLNKSDLFREKIKTIDMNCMFPDYTGGCDYDAGCDYLTKLFSKQVHIKKDLYTHVTCATDTGNIKVVFNAVREILLKDTFEATGI